MSLRFFRRIRIAPGISLNLSKSGGSLSLGPRGSKVTVGPRGVRKTVGLPGTGLWYTEHTGYGRKARAKSSRTRSAGSSPPAVDRRLNLGFFQKLLTPADEKAFIEGLKALQMNQPAEAYAQFIQAPEHADAVFTAAMMAMRTGKCEIAETLLKKALTMHHTLGSLYKKHGLNAAFSFDITERISVSITASRRGALLALAEVHQALGRWQDSVDELRALLRTNPADAFVRLSLCEILISESGDTAACREVVKLTQAVVNQSEVEAALLLWKGMALGKLGLHRPALDAFSVALRRKKDRSADLLIAIRYERALAYQALHNKSRYRADLETLYGQAPDYRDVAKRLGL